MSDRSLLYKADQLIIKLSQLVYKDEIADHIPYGLKGEVQEWLLFDSAKVNETDAHVEELVKAATKYRELVYTLLNVYANPGAAKIAGSMPDERLKNALSNFKEQP